MGESLACELVEAGALKFGTYTLKSGISSPFYVDLRVSVSYPKLLHDIATAVAAKIEEDGIQGDLLCGVPYTALPIATIVSMTTHKPMVMVRKEAKVYGTKRPIEGDFQPGQTCLIIEDIVSSGSSVIEIAKALSTAGLVVTDALVFMDREQGGRDNLLNWNIKLHSIFRITNILDILVSKNRLSPEAAKDVVAFVQSVKAPLVPSLTPPSPKKETYGQRSQLARCVLSKRLLGIMDEKKTNLAVAVDVTSTSKLLEAPLALVEACVDVNPGRLVDDVYHIDGIVVAVIDIDSHADLADALGPHICILKTHIDLLNDFSVESMMKLRDMANSHNFLILQDRKFADIGQTVQLQFSGGPFAMRVWTDMVTVHPLPGPGILSALKQACSAAQACVLVAEMSSTGALTTKSYTDAAVKMAEEFPEFVLGFVCQSRLCHNPGYVHMTPGVRLDATGDSLGQQYCDPASAVMERGADVIIVGRGITASSNPVEAALRYKKAGYDAYLSTLAGQ